MGDLKLTSALITRQSLPIDRGCLICNSRRTMIHVDDYRELISSVFNQRNQKNPSYSQRAFARDIGVSPSQLSEILSGKQGLSKLRARELAKTLFSESRKRHYFELLVQKQDARSKRLREAAELEIKLRFGTKETELEKSTLEFLSHWFFPALTELIYLKGFNSDLEWMSRILKVPAQRLSLALERLLGLKLLKKEAGQLLRANTELIRTPPEISAKAVRQLHYQILKKAERSLDEDPIEIREFNSLICAIDSERLPEFKEKLREFLIGFNEESSMGEKDQLYCLHQSFFPVSEKVESEK